MPDTYDGPTRIIVPALRGSLNQGTRLDLKIIVLGKRPPSLARLCWRKLGAGTFRQVPLAHQGAGIYSASIPAWAARGTGSFEYYLEVNDTTGQPVRYPPTAPALNQTVVVTP